MLQRGQGVDVKLGLAPGDGDHQAEADDDLGGGDAHHDQGEHLAGAVAQCRANAISARLEELSISSTESSRISGLRR